MMYRTLPLFVASATATLAQDRLLNLNSFPDETTTVDQCGGAVLQNEDGTELKCRFASRSDFEDFQDWTRSDYWRPPKWQRDWRSDQIETPSAGWKACKKVCVPPHEAWTSGLTSCSLTVDWLELKEAAKHDLKVDLKVDRNGLAGDKDENTISVKEIWNQMQAQFGLVGSNQEIGKDIENQVSALTDEQLEEKARQHMMTAMKNNDKISEWVKKNGVALVSYVLDQPDTWLEDKLGLAASEDKWVISEENKKKIGEAIERAKKSIKDKMGVIAAGFMIYMLNDIKTTIETDKLTNKYIIEKIHLMQESDKKIEGSVVSKMC